MWGSLKAGWRPEQWEAQEHLESKDQVCQLPGCSGHSLSAEPGQGQAVSNPQTSVAGQWQRTQEIVTHRPRSILLIKGSIWEGKLKPEKGPQILEL